MRSIQNSMDWLTSFLKSSMNLHPKLHLQAAATVVKEAANKLVAIPTTMEANAAARKKMECAENWRMDYIVNIGE